MEQKQLQIFSTVKLTRDSACCKVNDGLIIYVIRLFRHLRRQEICVVMRNGVKKPDKRDMNTAEVTKLVLDI
jgi:hypothetical protein